MMILLFPPPCTCNNRTFSETKTSKPPKDGFDLKANVCITTSMTQLLMDETLKDLAIRPNSLSESAHEKHAPQQNCGSLDGRRIRGWEQDI